MKESLSFETFAEGMLFIFNIVKDNKNININQTMDSYYALLSDLPEDFFKQGIINLMKKWEYSNIFPTPKKIRDEVIAAKRGCSEEDLDLIREIEKTFNISIFDKTKKLENN